jgi:hypothetical protein
VKIELIHPINHDKTEYARGIHDLPEELVKKFLVLKCGMTGASVARLPKEK